MKTYKPYAPFNPAPIYGEQHRIENGKILLNHIPYVNSIVIEGFKQTASVVVLQGQFYCNYNTETYYREADCTVYFNSKHEGETVSVDYLQVGTPITANDLNEIKAHMENSEIHSRYVLPPASADTRGGVRVGQGLTILGDVLMSDAKNFTLPAATADSLGGVKVGKGLTITDGILSAEAQNYTLPAATTDSLGGVFAGVTMSIEDGVLDYYLPTASASQLGGIKVGEGLTITDGILSADDQSYTLPVASASQLGGVKVGTGLTITDGLLSARTTNYTLPTAGTTVKGGAKVGYGLQMSGEFLNVILSTTPSTVEGAMWMQDAKIKFRCGGQIYVLTPAVEEEPAEPTASWSDEISYINYSRKLKFAYFYGVNTIDELATWSYTTTSEGEGLIILPEEIKEVEPVIRVIGDATNEDLIFDSDCQYDNYYSLYIRMSSDEVQRKLGYYDDRTTSATVKWSVKATKHTIVSQGYETLDSEIYALAADENAGYLYFYDGSFYYGLDNTTCLSNAFGGHLPASLKVYDGNGNLLTRDTDYTIYRYSEYASTCVIIIPQEKMVNSTLTVEYTTYEVVDYNSSYEEGDNDSWIYYNAGTSANVIDYIGSGKNVYTLTSLPVSQSKTGTAFYQTERARCFDLPATNEIWAKFDAYFDGENRWRAFNGGANGITGITAQTADNGGTTGLSFFTNNTNVSPNGANIAGVCIANQLQTMLLHMVSGSLDGIIEAWVDGTKIYTYTGDVNHGEDFADVYLQSDGEGTFFSSVSISPKQID